MLRSIQWKLVIISFLLVWLAMSIVGVYITEAIYRDQMDSMTAAIVARANYLADVLKDDMAGAPRIQDVVSNWFMGQGSQVKAVTQIKAVLVYNNRVEIVAREQNLVSIRGSGAIDRMIDRVFGGEPYVVDSSESTRNSISIAVPIISSNKDMMGAIYVYADLTSVQQSMDRIKNILSMATIWALCITALLGSVLAKTITGPIKEVTQTAEKLARGDFEQFISVKSGDEIGQLAEMFNYLTVRLKSTLNEMHSEKIKVETILKNMTDGVIAVGTNGSILLANPAVYKLFGIDKVRFEGKGFDEITEELQLGVTTKELFEETEKTNNIISVNGSIIRIGVVTFKNDKSEIAGAVLVLQDVTEQERLDNMRKDFVANVSHELRTPLTTIKSYTETLLDGAMENKEYTENFLKVIYSESERMTRLVKDLLQLSKLDYDKVQWNMKPVNIAAIIEDCVYKMNISARQKNQELAFEANAELPEITGDRDRIEQVMVNIIGNAIKYTPENGRVRIVVDQEENEAVIRVIDNGIGIPKEDIPRLFERFYRVDKARSRAMGGTGLGLSIARQIVEAHKGHIRVESDYGQGTEVVIKFPLV